MNDIHLMIFQERHINRECKKFDRPFYSWSYKSFVKYFQEEAEALRFQADSGK